MYGHFLLARDHETLHVMYGHLLPAHDHEYIVQYLDMIT